MKNKLNWIISISITTILLFSASAGAAMLIPANNNAKEHSQALENFSTIGLNWNLEKVTFIHYAKSLAKAKLPAATTCYKLMGVQWSSFPVNYTINPANTQGLSESFIVTSLSTGAKTWDTATSRELFNNNYTVDYSAKYGIQDFKNSIVFGDYDDNNVIAITSVWFTRVGKKIVEFDQLYNTRFSWGDTTADITKMDLQNMATHELGHAVGMDDIYSSTCGAVTMYGYSNEGEIKKRTLEQPDIMGLQKMYGI